MHGVYTIIYLRNILFRHFHYETNHWFSQCVPVLLSNFSHAIYINSYLIICISNNEFNNNMKLFSRNVNIHQIIFLDGNILRRRAIFQT